MINNFFFRGEVINLVTDSYRQPDGNIYTIIVGKNGTGKSTFLGSLVSEVLNTIRVRNDQRQNTLFPDIISGKIDYNSILNQVIAVSTSPFDKFPISRRGEISRKIDEVDSYTYLGLRDLSSSNFSLGYMAKITGSLVASVKQNPDQVYGINRILNYLGYSGIITTRVSLALPRSYINEILSSKDPIEFIKNQTHFSSSRINRPFFQDPYYFKSGLIIQLIDIIKKFVAYRHSLSAEFMISESGIYGSLMNFLTIDELIVSIQYGLFRIKDISLSSLKENNFFSIGEASSGEQSVILSILGIASQIKDNSLVCIDEPEICLHPEWQERYMQLLISTFKSYKNCHFVIATHSPQIISRLEHDNCFILSMESKKVRTANQFINHSADYQLANVFNFPGFKNEYLARVAVNTFAKVSKRKHFDQEDLDTLKLLEGLHSYLDNSDPVKDLYLTLKELLEIYG